MKALVLLAGTALALVVSASGVASSQRTVTISHVTRGCHAWDLGHGPMRPTMSFTVERGTLMKFVNNDVMPHRLVRTSGPRLQIRGANMDRMAASATVRFMRPGVYRLKTVFGAFFPWAASMSSNIGRMNVLRLTVRVQ